MDPWQTPGQGPQPYSGGWQGTPPPQPYGQPVNPYGQQANPYGQPVNPSPSGVTAIIAAVLSFLGAIANLAGGVLLLVGVAIIAGANAVVEDLPGWIYPYLIGSTVVQLAIGAALIVGGVKLLRRNPSGRIIIAVACAAVVVVIIIDVFTASAIEDAANSLNADSETGMPMEYGSMGAGNALSLIGLVFPIATAILALLPSTLRWCQVPRATAAAAPPPNPYYR